MLLPVMRDVRNFFEVTSESGDYEIRNGSVAVNGRYAVGQYIAITGSLLNNGVKRVESFEGGVISFIIPRDEYPAWLRPVGTIGLYSTGDRVTHSGERWVSLIDNNSWEPGTVGTQNLWDKIHDSPEEHSTTNEVFTGTIYGLRVPPDFVALCDEIAAFNEKNKPTNITSESFGSYSYTKASEASSGVIVGVAGWQSTFRRQLQPFRKMFSEVRI